MRPRGTRVALPYVQGEHLGINPYNEMYLADGADRPHYHRYAGWLNEVRSRKVRMGQGLVSVRWSQLGFGRTSSTSTGQATPRNLFGMKDGTDNLKAENASALDRYVWVPGSDGPGWLTGGSYLVTRRIRMLLEVWDRSSLEDQENNRRFVEIILAQATRLTNIASDLLSLSELESAALTALPQPVSIRAAIESALRTVPPR